MLKLNNNIKSIGNVFVGSANESVTSPKEYRVYFIAHVTYDNGFSIAEEIGFYDFKNKYGTFKNIFATEKEYKNYKSMLNYVYNNIDSMACIDTKIESKAVNTAKELIKAEDKALELKEAENNNIEVAKVETDVNSEPITVLEASEVTPDHNNEFILTETQQEQLNWKIERSIQGQAFDNTMIDMGYKTLEDKDRDKNNKSLVPMYLTKNEEFKNRVRKYELHLENDINFKDGIKQAFINELKEDAQVKMYEAKVWVTEDKDLTLDELEYKYANEFKAKDIYKKLHKDEVNQAITEATRDHAQTPEIKTIKPTITEGYTTLKQADNVQIIGKIESHTSYISNETYDMVVNLKIIKDNNIIYEAYRIDFPIDATDKDKININSYLDDIILYVNNSTLEPYWLNIQLDKLFKEKSTTKFQIAVKQLKNSITEENRIKESQQREKELQELKTNVIELANNKNMLVAIGSENIRLLKDLQQSQASKDFIKMILNMDINDKMIKPHLVKSFEAGDTVGLTYNDINKRLLLETKEFLDAM